MKIGIPTEIKNNESRVSLTPSGTYTLTAHGHSVYIQTGAGINSGFSDEQYIKAGATILPDAKSIFDTAEMIMNLSMKISSYLLTSILHRTRNLREL